MTRFSIMTRVAILLVLSLPSARAEEPSPPVFRLKLIYANTKLTAGDLFQEESLGSLITLQPSVLWDYPNLRSRIGLHFLGELYSKFGAFPVSGVGLSVYFHPLGLSAGNEISPEGTIIMRSRVSPYIFFGLTPVNLAATKQVSSSPVRVQTFSAVSLDTALALGLDFPVSPNVIIYFEAGQRFSAITSGEVDGQAISYSSTYFSLGFSVSYF